MDAIWNKKSAELHALTFYHLGQAENVWSHLIQFWAEIFFLQFWKCPHTWSTSAFFRWPHKKDRLYVSRTAGLVLIYLWTNFTDIDEKRDTRRTKNPCPANGRNFVTFVDNCLQPFCHLSPQQPFQEGGNYQSTPLLLSTTHQIHKLNEEKHF